MVEDVLVQAQKHNGWIPKYEDLPTVSDETTSSREKTPRCELKPLPAGLKYAFLGEDETYPVVISSKLELLNDSMLRKVLIDHRTAIGWTLFDIKGIIYPISDSKWVSPTQVVLKKSGVTVVENDNGEMPPDWSMPFEIMCDASNGAIGAVIRQRKDKEPVVISYASRTLNSAQKNYTTTEKELLAIVFALEKFRSYPASLDLAR
ncbi:hypothetical protein L3X38_045349 [Prunus dulcis]|uniref:Reverse transcriptase/retrotransposon-derived protein RNase H-like domain-containing protein n=1 Tax=Prunus dulcis TaxID=3755 RepID=A0AAD4V0P9_PRUDU|nr:hypothetical protein L3X38_045349 [Prunus dulcis]